MKFLKGLLTLFGLAFVILDWRFRIITQRFLNFMGKKYGIAKLQLIVNVAVFNFICVIPLFMFGLSVIASTYLVLMILLHYTLQKYEAHKYPGIFWVRTVFPRLWMLCSNIGMTIGMVLRWILKDPSSFNAVNTALVLWGWSFTLIVYLYCCMDPPPKEKKDRQRKLVTAQ